ncbi:uncharacterized protein LOC114672218 isoform X2 [Macaca mulatta]
MSQAPFPIEPLEGGVLERVHAWGAEHWCFCCLRLPCCSLDKGAGVNQSLWPSAASTILSKDCSYFLSTAGCQALWSALMNRTGEVPALRELMSNREADQVKGNTVKRTCNEEDPENM